MKKLMVILITGLLYMSCTDSMEVSGDADRNNTEDVSVRLVITIPASTTYARTRGTFATFFRFGHNIAGSLHTSHKPTPVLHSQGLFR